MLVLLYLSYVCIYILLNAEGFWELDHILYCLLILIHTYTQSRYKSDLKALFAQYQSAK